jgi:DNA-nicking Smr family endonuclease
MQLNFQKLLKAASVMPLFLSVDIFLDLHGTLFKNVQQALAAFQ